MITDTATPAPPTPTRPAAPPNAQVRTPSIDYATALPQSLALWRVDAEGQDFVGQPFRVVGQVHLQIEADEAGGEGLTAGAGVRAYRRIT